MCICCNIKCTLQCISQQTVMIEQSLNFLNTLLRANESDSNISQYLCQQFQQCGPGIPPFGKLGSQTKNWGPNVWHSMTSSAFIKIQFPVHQKYYHTERQRSVGNIQLIQIFSERQRCENYRHTSVISLSSV